MPATTADSEAQPADVTNCLFCGAIETYEESPAKSRPDGVGDVVNRTESIQPLDAGEPDMCSTVHDMVFTADIEYPR